MMETLPRPRAARKEVSRCGKCQKPLKDFATYIPDIGEVCMECWVEYAKKDEGELPPSKDVGSLVH